MGKTPQVPQQDVTNPQKDPNQSPLITSPLTQPVLSMQNSYGNSFMNGQMCTAGPVSTPAFGGGSPFGGPFGSPFFSGGFGWQTPNYTPLVPQGPRPANETPASPTIQASQNPQLNGPAATQTGAVTNTPADQQKAPDQQGQQIDPKAITAKSDALFKAMDGWGTDESAVMNSLKGMSPAEIEAVKKEYQDHYGRDLMGDIEGELGGSDLEEAKMHMSGNKVDGALAALNNSTGFFNDDEAKIEETLRSLKPEEMAELKKKAETDPNAKKILDSVGGALGGGDKEVFDALLAGETSKADAVRMDEAMGSSSAWYNPFSWGTDEEGVNKLMEGKSADERKALEDSFNQRMKDKGVNTNLRSEFTNEMSGATLDVSKALLEGDQVKANAARMKEAMEGWGTDEDKIYSMMKGKSPEERAALQASFEKEYGSLDQAMEAELSGDDLARAKMLKEKGELDPEFALHIATKGWGTDEAMVKEALAGKTPDQIAALKKKYGDSGYGNLDETLESELSGRDYFEAQQALKGEPQTPQEKLERARELYEFERGSGSNAFSRFMMDGAELIGMHSKGSQLDREMARMNGLFDENGNPRPGTTAAEVDKVWGYQQTDASNYKDAKDSVTNAVATGAEIGVAAIATVLTDGAASPWLVAAISAAAGGTAGIVVKAGMQGDAYGREDLAIDTGKVIVSTLTAGLGETKMVGDKLDDLVSTFGGPATQAILSNGLKSGGQGMINGLYEGATNDQNWDKGMEHWLAGMGSSSFKGFTGGFAGGAAQQGVKGYFGPQVGYMKSAGVDGLAGMASSVATTSVDPATYSGDPEAIFTNFGKSALSGFGSGAIQGLADRKARAGTLEYAAKNGLEMDADAYAALTPDEKARVDAAKTASTQTTVPAGQTATGEPSIVTQDPDGNATVTPVAGDDSNKASADTNPTKATTTSTTTDPTSTTNPAKHPDVATMETLLGTNDTGIIKNHLKSLTDGTNDNALLEVAVALPEMMKTMTPEQINIVGKHLFAEGHQLDALLRNGKKTGQVNGENQYSGLSPDEVKAVKAQQERSALLGQSWADNLAKQGLDPFGNKISQTLSITGEDWSNPAYNKWAKKIQSETGSWTDMDLPSTMWSYQGNIDRYTDTHVNLFGGENGVRIFGKGGPNGGPGMNNDGTMKSSVTANEVEAGSSVAFHGPGAQSNGYSMLLNPGLPGYGTPGFNASAPDIKAGGFDQSLGWLLWGWQNKVNKGGPNPTK